MEHNEKDFEPQIIKTQDENGEIHNFELIDIMTIEEQDYGMMLYIEDENAKPSEDEEQEVVIMKINKDEEDNFIFEAIESDEEFNKVVNIMQTEYEASSEEDEDDDDDENEE